MIISKPSYRLVSPLLVMIYWGYGGHLLSAQSADANLASRLTSYGFEVRTSFLDSSLVAAPNELYNGYLHTEFIGAFKMRHKSTRIDVLTAKKDIFPQVQLGALMASIGYNDHDAYVTIKPYSEEECRIKFNSDWGAYVDLRPKEDLEQDFEQMRLHYLWKENHYPLIVIVLSHKLSPNDKELVYNFRYQ